MNEPTAVGQNRVAAVFVDVAKTEIFIGDQRNMVFKPKSAEQWMMMFGGG